MDAWKYSEEVDPNVSDYDTELVRRKKRELLELRSTSNIQLLVNCVKTCLDSSLVGTLNPALYSMTYSGTKKLSEEFQEEVVKSIDYLTGNHSLIESSQFSSSVWSIIHHTEEMEAIW